MPLCASWKSSQNETICSHFGILPTARPSSFFCCKFDALINSYGSAWISPWLLVNYSHSLSHFHLLTHYYLLTYCIWYVLNQTLNSAQTYRALYIVLFRQNLESRLRLCYGLVTYTHLSKQTEHVLTLQQVYGSWAEMLGHGNTQSTRRGRGENDPKSGTNAA